MLYIEDLWEEFVRDYLPVLAEKNSARASGLEADWMCTDEEATFGWAMLYCWQNQIRISPEFAEKMQQVIPFHPGPYSDWDYTGMIYSHLNACVEGNFKQDA